MTGGGSRPPPPTGQAPATLCSWRLNMWNKCQSWELLILVIFSFFWFWLCRFVLYWGLIVVFCHQQARPPPTDPPPRAVTVDGCITAEETRAARGETESRAGVNPPAPHWRWFLWFRWLCLSALRLWFGPQRQRGPLSIAEVCLRAGEKTAQKPKTGNFIPALLLFLHEVHFLKSLLKARLWRQFACWGRTAVCWKVSHWICDTFCENDIYTFYFPSAASRPDEVRRNVCKS